MLSISFEPLSAGQARTYHARESASEKQNHWSRGQRAPPEWQGKLASQWGLHGAVGSEHFARLSEGRHPQTEVQLVRHSRIEDLRRQERQGGDFSRAPGRVGCDVFRAEVGLGDGIGGGNDPLIPLPPASTRERFVAREPTVCVHECPVAVLVQT